ncbi:hypothetical protein ORI20_32175 [Mycobacterium sp. CVI_P3]|uniref:Transposase n=1 Tax=Mycobacterium pinniadriaticum TaxID=2994102 RepID=A0ABT3SPA4_9MYCO|nr:hypothetical protein [Mycobacterium pinniadriaticum]MCX2934923.1 hypothetical protein [Mycobacterium pinniadriaticum]MCX2941345.1 hypothetical protein [Mycobacterium pinniadriaticum]
MNEAAATAWKEIHGTLSHPAPKRFGRRSDCPHFTRTGSWMMEVPPRLVELADLADSCRTVFLRTADISRWRPGPNSLAAKAQKAITLRDPAGFTLVSEVVVTYLEIASNHFAGLAVLYRYGQAMFPQFRSLDQSWS